MTDSWRDSYPIKAGQWSSGPETECKEIGETEVVKVNDREGAQVTLESLREAFGDAYGIYLSDFAVTQHGVVYIIDRVTDIERRAVPRLVPGDIVLTAAELYRAQIAKTLPKAV